MLAKLSSTKGVKKAIRVLAAPNQWTHDDSKSEEMYLALDEKFVLITQKDYHFLLLLTKETRDSTQG